MVLALVDKVVVAIAGFFAISLLLPELISSLGSFDWANVTVGGETKDYSLVPKIFILGLMLSLVIFGIRQIPGVGGKR